MVVLYNSLTFYRKGEVNEKGNVGMSQLNQSELQLHVTILGWLHVGGAAMFLLGGIIVTTLFTGIGVAVGDSTVITILSTIGTVVGLLLAGMAILAIVVGYGLLTRRPWSRIMAIVLGIFSLPNFPLGTMIGVYTLWILLQEAANNYFMSFKSV